MSKRAFQNALISQGVDSDLADQAAEILANDDANKPNLGRTPEQQQIINQAWEQGTKNGR